MADQIDQAIAAAAEPDPIRMIAIPVQLSSSGRPAQINIPEDATDGELADLAGWLLTQVRAHVAENRGPRSRLVIPNRIVTE